MKLLLLVACICIALSSQSQTSIYHPFPESDAYWNVDKSQAMCFMGGGISENYSLVLSGDTLINNFTYHKLIVPFVDVSIYGNCTQSFFPGYKGAIRQDITAKKVFFVPPSFSDEHLLYDFNLQTGDTVKGYLYSGMFHQDTVVETDSVLVGETYRKRWLLNPCYQIYLIEGVGSTFGLIEPSPGCATDMDYFALECFSQNAQALFPSNATGCELITSLPEVIESKAALRVFPNPSSETITVDVADLQNNTEIIIYNIFGNQVSRTILTHKQNLSITDLPAATYILKIIAEGRQTETHRIIVAPAYH